MATMHVDGGRPRELNIEIEPCKCGGQVRFRIAYGRTPYGFFCNSCGTNFQNDITNCGGEGAIEYFNLYITGKEQPFAFEEHNISNLNSAEERN